MNLIYDSECFYVVEYPAQHGYELVDKQARRVTFFQGRIAEKFVQSMRDVVAEENVSFERLDEFLGNFDLLMSQPVRIH